MQYHFEDPWRGGGRNQNFRKFLGKFREIPEFSRKFLRDFQENSPTPRGMDNICGGCPQPRGVGNMRGVSENPPGTSDSIF